jgi:hypothetical protein
MRPLILACLCLLAGCSTQTVRCDQHLTAINVPSRPLASAVTPASAAKQPSEGDESSKHQSSAQSAPPVRPGEER